ncbi:hypothetical protein TSH58p_25335 (plasmid) [Azospirillum sp. TSH58]|nr:hypothetical protein TSH58p_25335 [Azospirillum sp. TSH58]PWC62888.1 hypothetical protein TSH58_24515 [Azospirillum sp. TSH58]
MSSTMGSNAVQFSDEQVNEAFRILQNFRYDVRPASGQPELSYCASPLSYVARLVLPQEIAQPLRVVLVGMGAHDDVDVGYLRSQNV